MEPVRYDGRERLPSCRRLIRDVQNPADCRDFRSPVGTPDTIEQIAQCAFINLESLRLQRGESLFCWQKDRFGCVLSRCDRRNSTYASRVRGGSFPCVSTPESRFRIVDIGTAASDRGADCRLGSASYALRCNRGRFSLQNVPDFLIGHPRLNENGDLSGCLFYRRHFIGCQILDGVRVFIGSA